MIYSEEIEIIHFDSLLAIYFYIRFDGALSRYQRLCCVNLLVNQKPSDEQCHFSALIIAAIANSNFDANGEKVCGVGETICKFKSVRVRP